MRWPQRSPLPFNWSVMMKSPSFDSLGGDISIKNALVNPKETCPACGAPDGVSNCGVARCGRTGLGPRHSPKNRVIIFVGKLCSNHSNEGRAMPQNGIARASVVVRESATMAPARIRGILSVGARPMATPEVHCLKGPKSPFLLDDSVGRCIESFTYAATALWPVADPIHRSVTHTCSAETVTDLTLPKCDCCSRCRELRSGPVFLP
jgi:hypothetical protein